MGNKEEKEDKDQLVFKRLAQRSFKRTWGITDDTEVQKVEFEDGLLVNGKIFKYDEKGKLILTKIVKDRNIIKVIRE